MTSGQTLQELFLDALCAQQVQVSIYLVNGIKLQGKIEGYDEIVVMLKSTLSQMVYKHAISTIVPAHKVEVGAEEVTTEKVSL